MTRHKRLVALLALVVAVLAVAIPAGNAQAVPLKKWCRDLPEDAEAVSIGRSCTVYGTAKVGPSLDLPPGQTLTIADGASLTNEGTLGTSGTIVNEGTIINSASLNNNGTIKNLGYIQNGGVLNNNGTIENNQTIQNDGTIVNCGSISGNSIDGNLPESCP